MSSTSTPINLRSFLIGFVAAIVMGAATLAILGYNATARADDSSGGYQFVADANGGLWVCHTFTGSVYYKSK